MNKRTLYNKIMSNVAVQVKKALNEEYNGNDLKSDCDAVVKTIITICNRYDVTSMLIDDSIHSYYNDARLDDLDTELDYIAVFDDEIYVRTINRTAVDLEALSARDLDTLYYIVRNIVADSADFVSDPYEIYEEMDTIYQSALEGTLHIGYEITDEDKERLYKAFEECGYEECDFLKVDGEPIVLDSIYNGENVSIDVISCNLACRLSSTEFNKSGATVRLEDIINNPDDIDTLENVITDYVE